MALRIFILLSFIIATVSQTFAQCQITATISPTTSVCGDCAVLTAFGRGQGQQVFNETFNSGTPSGWAFTQQATFTNPCSPGGVDGTSHLWMGSASAVPRSLVTQSYNFTAATSGATVCFDMLFAEQGDAAPCEGPDEPQEGVFLQYSTNGGSTWTTIHYFDPNGGNDPTLVNWNNWCFQLPPAALGPNTQIRFFQDADSGADYDHWGIDNVAIYYNDPTYNITWQHDGYSYGQGSSGGASPNRVCPQTTTDYFVVMTNGTTTCRDTVRLTVTNPTIQVNAGNDTSICPGTCANLNATAKVVKSPQQTPTYSNNEFQVIAPGSPAEININVTGLNNLTINPVVIQSVCIGSLTYFGTGLDFSVFPPQPVTITARNLRFELVCPDGTVLVLLPQNVINQGNTITNLCFVPAGPAITTGSPPYTGSFSPNQPFTNLNGCSSNGVWKLRVSLPGAAFGTGFFNNWRITFTDPEISYPADITWSPTTNMTGSNTLTPQVCPTGTQTYTLTATDTAGCVTVTDQVTVTVQPSCCNLNFTAAKTDPTCGASNGSITITPTTGVGPYTYTWTPGGVLGASRTGLPAGSYTIRIADSGQPNCFRDTTIILATTAVPVINSITPTPELCAGNNAGSVAVSASGGTGALTYTWNPAGPNSPNRNNLAPGTYTVTVTDALGCSATASTVLAAGPVCCTLAISVASINPTCAGLDGSITINVTTGSGNYTYAWTGGFSSTNTLANIGAGTYTVTVTDITQGCNRDTTIILNSATGPIVNNVVVTNETCLGNNDGTATVTASGGTGAFTYEWNTTPIQTTATANNLQPGCYSVVVTDALGCEAFGQICVAAGPNCCNITYTIATANPACGQSNGAVTISNLGHPGYSFLWGGGQTSQSLTGLVAGVYTVTITDSRYPNCQRDTTITLTNPNAPTISIITATAESCLGAADGTVDMTLAGGTTPYTIVWSNSAVTEDLTGLAPGNYTVTVTDAANCQVTGFINVAAGPNCCNLSFGVNVVPPTCGQTNGSLEVVNIVGTGPFSTLWSNGATTNLISNLSANTYSLTITDNGQTNCSRDTTITLNNPGAPTITSATANNETCAGANDGTASLVISGGAAPVVCTWSNGGNTFTINSLAPGTYTATITDANGCNATAQVTVAPGPQCCSLNATATTTPANCGSADGSITITVDTPSGTPPFVYNVNGGAFGNSNVFAVAGGNYTVIARDANNCADTLQLTVPNNNSSLVLTTFSQNPTCPGSSDGWVAVGVSGGTPPVSILWSNTNVTDTVFNLAQGNYNVTVTDQTNCAAFANVALTDPAPLAVSLGADWELCDGQNATLDAGLADSYLWSTGDTTPTILANVTGTYSVTVTNAGGCTATDTVLVNIAPAFTVDAGEDTTVVQYESVFNLNGTVNGSAGGNYLWTPNTFLTCNNCPSPSLSPDSTTVYVLTYTDAFGCSASDSVTVTVLPGEYFAIVPNAFSPNNDGVNEFLFVYHAGVKRLVFRVHDRWGEKVFETDDKNAGWDGTLKGIPAQDGVYVWDLYVEFLNVKIPSQRKKGSVLLLK